MKLFRMVQNRSSALDLSGLGAFKYGGRWNGRGTYMLYCSENSSLAYLESLVHFDPMCMPSNLFVIELHLTKETLLHTLADQDYPANWMTLGSLENQQLGDRWMGDLKYLGIRVRSAINPLEHNVMLNPRFPDFHHLIRINQVHELKVDGRL